MNIVLIDPLRRVVERIDVGANPPWASGSANADSWIAIPIASAGGAPLELRLDLDNVDQHDLGHFMLGGVAFTGAAAVTGAGGAACPDLMEWPDVQWINSRYAEGLRLYMKDVAGARALIQSVLDLNGCPF